ncbi:hypothetical protein C7S15_5968 [Burkholderia cepacia]|nr:hypothetical protein [Burkholderia cepacia]
MAARRPASGGIDGGASREPELVRLSARAAYPADPATPPADRSAAETRK